MGINAKYPALRVDLYPKKLRNALDRGIRFGHIELVSNVLYVLLFVTVTVTGFNIFFFTHKVDAKLLRLSLKQSVIRALQEEV